MAKASDKKENKNQCKVDLTLNVWLMYIELDTKL